LKPSVRLGLLAVFIVLAAALGATTQFVDVGVAQAQTKDCTAGTTAGTVSCTLTIPTLVAGPATTTVTLTSAPTAGATYTAVTITGATGTVTAPVIAPDGLSFAIDCTTPPPAPATGCSVTLAETITAPAGTTSLTQTGAGDTAFVASDTTIGAPAAPTITAAAMTCEIGFITVDDDEVTDLNADCTKTFTMTAGTATITLTGPAGASFEEATATGAGVTLGTVTDTTITVICAPVAPATTCPVTLDETIDDVTFGATVTQTVNGTTLTDELDVTTEDLAFLIGAGVIAKDCEFVSVDVGNEFDCDIVFGVDLPSPIEITVGGPVTIEDVDVIGGSVDFENDDDDTGGVITITCDDAVAGTPGDFCLAGLTVTEHLVFNASGALTERITLVGDDVVSAPLPAIVSGIGAAGAGPTSITKTCVTPPDGVPVSTAANIFVRVGGSITCTVTVTFAPGTAVTPTTATVVLPTGTFGTPGTAGVFGPGGTLTVGLGAGTGTLTCIPPTPQTTPPTCLFTETFFPTEAASCAPLGAQTITVAGITVSVAIGGTVGTTTGVPFFVLPKLGSGVVCPVLPATTLNQPKFLDFECKNGIDTFGDPIIPIIPGEIGGVFVDAIGVLPGALICQVVLLDAAGLEIAAPGGKIEVSSINGTLIDASGQLTTNLRIQCGSIPSPLTTGGTVFTGLGTVGVTGLANDCLGVQFAVVGRGVGFVELNARYEPNAFAIQAGIHEAEGVGSVAFIAPAVDLVLDLAPNPATVNQRVTATALFNEVIVTVAGVPLIDPTTGVPFTEFLGSRLSGNVVFSTSSTSVAPFIGTQLSLTGQEAGAAGGTADLPNVDVSGQFAGVTQSVTVRCGGLGPLGAAATFASFFQGCDSAQAILLARAQGSSTISATFIPDLPGAFGAGALIGGTANLDAAAALLGLFAPATGGLNTDAEVLLVIGEAPTGNVQLSRGCNNVSPTVTETAAAYAQRVDPAAALVAIWEHQAATNTFRGWSPQAGAPNDLSGVTRLRPVFVCVSSAATLNQPPA
jgi:hypothetical protein